MGFSVRATMATANTAAVQRAKRASIAGRRSILTAPTAATLVSAGGDGAASASSVEPSKPAAAKEEQPGMSTTTRNTAAVARARQSTLMARQSVGGRQSVAGRQSVGGRQSVIGFDGSKAVAYEGAANPLQLVKRLSEEIVRATTEVVEKLAQRSESVASLLEFVSPREPEHVLFGELQLYKGWGSWGAPARPPTRPPARPQCRLSASSPPSA